ncbi:MAG: hypothetical protein PHQ96_05860 [Candidatus Omnitrophica bacterium]|nr:hypothetical protein [Candidatus Omnitrophota bacterium]
MSIKKLIALSCVFHLLAIPLTYSDNISNKFQGGDGSAIEKGIIIPDISDYKKCSKDPECVKQEYSKSIDQEYEYLKEVYGIKRQDWEFKNQSLLENNGKLYDELTILIIKSNELKKIYFDITEPFGNFAKQFEK